MYRSRILHTAIALLLLVTAGCNRDESRNPRTAQTTTLTAEQMREDLAQYHEAIVNAWAYYESKTNDHSVDVSKTRDQLAARVSPETTPLEFALLLREFAASLKDGHSDVIVSSIADPFPYSWPMGFVSVREGVMVANLNWLADNPGVELGDLLTMVDGEPIEEYLRSRMALTPASSDLARRTIAVDRLHRSASENVRLEFIKQDDSTIEAVFQCLPEIVSFRTRDLRTFCQHGSVEDFTMIKIPSFTWNNIAFFAATSDQEREEALVLAKNQIDEAFAATSQARGVILDLRDNEGGLELLSTYVAEHLVSGDFTYFELERRDSRLLRSRPAYQGMDDNAFATRRPERPRNWQGFKHFDGQVYDGSLVVMINERCFSTTDNLCAFLKDVRPDTWFVGRPTHGGTGEPAIVDVLSNCGAQIQFCVSRVYSPSGQMIEGHGTLPDVAVEADRESKLQRRDIVLEAALKLLQDLR